LSPPLYLTHLIVNSHFILRLKDPWKPLSAWDDIWSFM